MRYVLSVGIYVALVGFCVTDVMNRPERHPHGLHRWLWIGLIVLVPYLGAIVWLILKFRGGGSKPKPRGPRAPDDDPEYLSWIGEQERRRKMRGEES